LVAKEFLCSFVDYKNSRMFGNLPSDVKTDLMKKNVTPNFHSYGVTEEHKNSLATNRNCQHLFLWSLKNLSASFPLVIEELVSIFSFGH
jgi:hypothetical protein